MRKMKQEMPEGFNFLLAELMSEGGFFSDYLNYLDGEDRQFYLTDEINQMTVEGIVKSIIRANKEDTGIEKDKRKPVMLYISSNGGEIDAGMQLIDTIMNSTTPIYTVNLGCNYSMALLIGIAGHKRYAMPNAKYLMHDGFALIGDSVAKLQDQMEFHKANNERIKSYILSRTKLTSEKFDEKYRFEWYFFADEAKEYGFTDSIIGQDITMEDLINA